MTTDLAPRRALLLLCLLPAAMGCEDGHPYNTLDKTRLLAVRAAPPELSSGQAATLDALVYTPEGAELSYAWSWCPWSLGANEGFACVLTQDDLNATGLPLPPLDLGTEPTATFAYPGPTELVQRFCESFLEGIPPAARNNFPDCTKGMPVTIYLAVSDGETEITAMKEIDLRVAPTERPNYNPVLRDLSATKAGNTFSFENGTELTADTPYDLLLGLEEGSDQTYPSTDIAGEPIDRTELLTFTWFWTKGDADSGRTGSVDEGDGLDKALRNTWRTPKKAQSVDFIVVARDDRGGTDWLQRTVDVLGGGQ